MFTTQFLLTSLIVVLIPGTGVVFTVSMALAHGRGASFFAAVGCTLGIVPHLLATALGLVVKAFQINILNPKLTIYFLDFLPQFVALVGRAIVLAAIARLERRAHGDDFRCVRRVRMAGA